MPKCSHAHVACGDTIFWQLLVRSSQMERPTIQRHVPERGSRGQAIAPAGQCCCCCCCCLHTVGGIIGAATARASAAPISALPPATIDGATRTAKPSATGLYWGMVLLVSIFVAMWNLGVERHPDSAEAVLIIALVLPGIQLGASMIAAIVIVLSKRPRKDERLRHLGKITFRAFIGAVIGGLVMLPLFGK
jgi:hypothetical protein